MNKWTLKFLAATAVGVLTLAGQAHAAVSYSYVTDAGPNGNYNVAPGVTQTVKLYLLETLTGGSPSIISADGGMAGVAMQVNRPAVGGGSALGALTYNITDFSGPSTPASGPGGVSPAQQPNHLAFAETGPLQGASPVPGNSGGNAANVKPFAVFLGTIDVIAGSAAGVTTFTLDRIDTGTTGGTGDTITTFNNYDLDKLANASPAYAGTAASTPSSSFTVTVVPEPTFAGIAMVVGAVGSLIRRRRQA